MLTKPDITSLMRDADPSEEALYATSNDPRAVLNRASSELKAAYSKTNSRRKNDPADVGLICAAVDSVTEIYPLPGIREKTERLRARYDYFQTSIAKQEDRIEHQRQQLTRMTLSSGVVTASNLESLNQQQQQKAVESLTSVQAAEKIEQLRAEIAQLEADEEENLV
ncbi:uncharacterized protein SAPINGB_P006129 [Magnusiomyces paraingens]|uniref:DASH complex subunit SPC34 n=1 Tax=Magnusiomyces paraingens TaxID=2606893 RepID=A0A5E8C3F5_9ASCO|nr:uncharacterized protein SAPINGB_P006129 [Saprochaete ingens]VVT58284.1 unnamed protein product [Saprochaete ingens]